MNDSAAAPRIGR